MATASASRVPLQWTDPATGAISTGYRETDIRRRPVNFLALLGWNPGDDPEIMTMEELIDRLHSTTAHAPAHASTSKKENGLTTNTRR